MRGALLAALAASGTSSVEAADPLPSWNDGAARRSIVAFVEKVTREGGAGYVPPAERIAVFDNDGTLWSEQPMYFQAFFIFDRIKALAPQHPEWKDKEPFASVLKGDVKAALAGGEQALVEMAMATHAGMTTEEFEKVVTDWIATAKHPKTGRLYTEMVYQPMLELLAYLRANGFKTFIVSGGGIEFMRPWAERVYGIPPEQVVGSSIKTKFELRDGKPVLVRLPEINFVDDKAGQARRDPDAHRPAPDRRVRQLRRRPADAAVDGRRLREPLLPLRPPHRRRARVGLRPPVVDRPPRQGPRRGAGKGLDGRGHEDRLEADLPVQPGAVSMAEGHETPDGRDRGRPLARRRRRRRGPRSEDILPPARLPGVEPDVPELAQGPDLEVGHHLFTLHLGLVPILDYTWFTQDQASIDQVGVQENDFDIRSARIMARGTIFAHSKHAPRYLVAFEYRGFDSDPNQSPGTSPTSR